MSDKEIISFWPACQETGVDQLPNAVGCQTCADQITYPERLKTKTRVRIFDRLVSEGGLLDLKGSVWLKDFWELYGDRDFLLLP